MSFSYFLGIYVYSYNFWVKGYMCLKLSHTVTNRLSQMHSLCPTSHPGVGSVISAQLSPSWGHQYEAFKQRRKMLLVNI